MEGNVVSMFVQHGPEIIEALWWMGGVLVLIIAALFTLFLNSIKREVSLLLTNINLQLTTLNEAVRSVKQEVAQDVSLMREEQKKLWSHISEAKKNINQLHTAVAVIKNNCEFYHGPERREKPRKEGTEK